MPEPTAVVASDSELPKGSPTSYEGCSLLGGSWVVISGVISRVTRLITHIRGLITLLITTHEPPSRALGVPTSTTTLLLSLLLIRSTESHSFFACSSYVLGAFHTGRRYPTTTDYTKP